MLKKIVVLFILSLIPSISFSAIEQVFLKDYHDAEYVVLDGSANVSQNGIASGVWPIGTLLSSESFSLDKRIKKISIFSVSEKKGNTPLVKMDDYEISQPVQGESDRARVEMVFTGRVLNKDGSITGDIRAVAYLNDKLQKETFHKDVVLRESSKASFEGAQILSDKGEKDPLKGRIEVFTQTKPLLILRLNVTPDRVGGMKNGINELAWFVEAAGLKHDEEIPIEYIKIQQCLPRFTGLKEVVSLSKKTNTSVSLKGFSGLEQGSAFTRIIENYCFFDISVKFNPIFAYSLRQIPDGKNSIISYIRQRVVSDVPFYRQGLAKVSVLNPPDVENPTRIKWDQKYSVTAKIPSNIIRAPMLQQTRILLNLSKSFHS